MLHCPAMSEPTSPDQLFSDLDFTDVDLPGELLAAVNDLGFDRLTRVQAEVLPLSLEGRDIVAQAQTGSMGTSAGASAGPATNTQAGTRYRKGLAVFVLRHRPPCCRPRKQDARAYWPTRTSLCETSPHPARQHNAAAIQEQRIAIFAKGRFEG